MIDRPGVHLRMTRGRSTPGERFTATGPLSDRVEAFASLCASAWQLDDRATCRLEVLEMPDSHAGLGSGTQLGLAVAAGMKQLFGPPAAIAAPEAVVRFDTSDAVALARAVGRGRRSCVGIYGFSSGGLIVEGGRLLPLGGGGEADATRPFSPLLARVALPSAWRCVVFSLRDAIGLHGVAEKQAFASLAPVPAGITAELSRHALTSLLPAAVDGQFEEFSDALMHYGHLAGKPFEEVSSQLPHAQITARLIDSLQQLGARGSAQSSWGPTVMACCESSAAADSLVERFAAVDLATHYDTLIARFADQGAVLREVVLREGVLQEVSADQARVTDRP